MGEIVEKRVLKLRKVFNEKRYNELLENPPKTLNYNGEDFFIDPDFFRHQCKYIYNMLFKILDVRGLHGGEEGTGKTTDASQIGFSFHYIMVECNILNKELGTYYEYNEENCLAHNLISFLKKCDKYNDEIFRIIICDEAGGLKGEERWDEYNKKFREEMRKDRKKLRILLFCFPQILELVKDFTMGRCNFIRLNTFRMKKGYGLINDEVRIILIPRGDYSFSFITNQLVSKGELKNALYEQSKEKYTKEFPKKLLYKITRKDNVFCFDVDNYIKQAKEENRLFLKEEKIYLSNNLIFIIAKHLTAGKIGLSIKKPTGNEEEEERKQMIEERKQALLISKLVNKCREIVKKNSKLDLGEIKEIEDES